MKNKSLILMFLMFGILVSLSVLISAECTETDIWAGGGLNYKVKGGISLYEGHFWEDNCVNGNQLFEFVCTMPNYGTSFNCPNGCSDGACIDSTEGGTSTISGVSNIPSVATSNLNTGTKTKSASAKKSSGSKICPASMTETTSADGVSCCIPKSGRTTGRFLGFMFRN